MATSNATNVGHLGSPEKFASRPATRPTARGTHRDLPVTTTWVCFAGPSSFGSAIRFIAAPLSLLGFAPVNKVARLPAKECREEQQGCFQDGDVQGDGRRSIWWEQEQPEQLQKNDEARDTDEQEEADCDPLQQPQHANNSTARQK